MNCVFNHTDHDTWIANAARRLDSRNCTGTCCLRTAHDMIADRATRNVAAKLEPVFCGMARILSKHQQRLLHLAALTGISASDPLQQHRNTHAHTHTHTQTHTYMSNCMAECWSWGWEVSQVYAFICIHVYITYRLVNTHRETERERERETDRWLGGNPWPTIYIYIYIYIYR